jgi:non-specific serine/threonine protein kinase
VARRLLSATPSVRVLATSREPLRIPGEALFPLSGLDIPGPREVLSPDRVSQFDSVRLFVERACAALPDFTLDGDNADLVAAICHRLDGIPLAIELAAARVRSAPLATIAARLKDRFRLLRSSDPTALPRQRTLAATIDWSHELLPADERVLFRRMAVFSGGCTLDSLELVCGDAGAEADALELVARLVEKSLVTFNDATGRYSLLDTVREYALGRLEESGELRESRERHFRHYVDMANASKAAMAGDDGAAVLGRLDAERENFLAAHQWAGVGGDPQAGMAMLNALKPYWWGHGLLRLAEGALTEALARPGAAPRTRARGQSLFIAGQLRSFMGRHDEALPLLEESLAIARELGDSRGISTVCQALGSAELAAGHFGLARAHLDEATTIARGAGEERALAAALSARVQLHRLERQTLEAATLAEECVRLGNSLGDAAVRANGLLNAAMISLDLGRGREARETARALAADAPGLRHLQTRAGMLDVALGLSAYAHEWARVALLWGAAEALAEETGYRRDAADEAFVASRLAEGRAELGARFEEAAARGRGLQVDESLARAIECIEAPVPAASAAGL